MSPEGAGTQDNSDQRPLACSTESRPPSTRILGSAIAVAIGLVKTTVFSQTVSLPNLLGRATCARDRERTAERSDLTHNTFYCPNGQMHSYVPENSASIAGPFKQALSRRFLPEDGTQVIQGHLMTCAA